MSNNGIEIHKITEGVVYLEGKSMLGKCEGVDMPELKFLFEEFKALGMIGKMELPTNGVDKLEGKMKMNSLYADVARQMTPFRARQIQVRSSVSVHTSMGRTAEVPLVTFLTISPKNMPLGKLGDKKNVDFEYDFACTYVKQVMDGVEIVEYDAMANIFKIGGVDMLADYRSNVM